MYDLSRTPCFYSVVGLVRRTAFVLALEYPMQVEPSSKFSRHKFNASLTKATSHRFVDHLLSLVVALATIAGPWSFWHVSVFSLSRSSKVSSTVIFDRLALNVDVETTGRIGTRLLVQLLQPSAKFSAQAELNDFFRFFCIAVADEHGHD